MNNSIRLEREKRSLTQEDLARAVSVTRQTIISLERGRYNPSLELAFRLAEAFDLVLKIFSTQKVQTRKIEWKTNLTEKNCSKNCMPDTLHRSGYSHNYQRESRHGNRAYFR